MFSGADMFGVRLTVMAGQGVPRPLPFVAMQQFVSAEIAISDRERSGFELVFDAVRAGMLAGVFPIMKEPALRAGARVVLVATIGVRPTVLMDGIIETSEFRPSEGNGPAKLHVRGKDLSFVMDREEVQTTHPGMGPGEIATMILLKYARFGVIPQVVPPAAADRPNPTDYMPTQNGTDYKFLTELAEEFDRIFTVIPGPAPLSSIGYWGPPPRLGAPQAAISTDMGPATNVSGLNFENNASDAASVSGQVQDRSSGQSVPVRSVAPYRAPLAAFPEIANAITAAQQIFRAGSGNSVAQAMGQAQAQSDASTDVLRVTGDLDTGRYGAVLSPRGLVGMRGAGLDHDGLYYVQSVVHKIASGSWTQSFTLTREGTGSTVPMVRP